MNVNEIKQDCDDRINESENGQLSFDLFNRFSWMAQLQMMYWVSGDIDGKTPPQPYESQKNRDWLSPFITPLPTQVINGKVAKPDDYYQFENMYVLGQFNETSNCYDLIINDGVQKNTDIELLSGSKFTSRSETYIEGLQPSFTSPIAKIVGNNFVFNPTDLGSITLEYIRYPQKAILNTKLDPVYNEPVYDPTTSIDFEWGEYARESLVWFICDFFANRTREQALKTFNQATKNP